MKQFNFYINGMDFKKYAQILIHQNGIESVVIKKLNSEYQKLSKSGTRYADALLAVRNYLESSGFVSEVEKCDFEFMKGKENRKPENPYITMSKRWKRE